jgi:hypothetical protein
MFGLDIIEQYTAQDEAYWAERNIPLRHLGRAGAGITYNNTWCWYIPLQMHCPSMRCIHSKFSQILKTAQILCICLTADLNFASGYKRNLHSQCSAVFGRFRLRWLPLQLIVQLCVMEMGQWKFCDRSSGTLFARSTRNLRTYRELLSKNSLKIRKRQLKLLATPYKIFTPRKRLWEKSRDGNSEEMNRKGLWGEIVAYDGPTTSGGYPTLLSDDIIWTKDKWERR